MIILTLMSGEVIEVDKTKIRAMKETFKGSRFWFTEVDLTDRVINVRETVSEIKERMSGGNG